MMNPHLHNGNRMLGYKSTLFRLYSLLRPSSTRLRVLDTTRHGVTAWCEVNHNNIVAAAGIFARNWMARSIDVFKTIRPLYTGRLQYRVTIWPQVDTRPAKFLARVRYASKLFSARCAVVRTNRRAIAMMFNHLSVSLGRECILIIRRNSFYTNIGKMKTILHYLFIYLKAKGPKGHLHCSEVHSCTSLQCKIQ